MNKFTQTAAARTAPKVKPEKKATMVTTVEVPVHTRAELDRLFVTLGLEHGRRRRFGIGAASVALYEILLDNPLVQEDGALIPLQELLTRRLT